MTRIIATFEIEQLIGDDGKPISNEEMEDALSDIHQDMTLVCWGTI